MAEEKEIIEDENKIGTVVAEDIEFRGTLKFKNSLKIKGFFEGKIETDGHLIVGQEATVSADMRANTVSVSGVANGKITATKHIELFNKSTTNCDISTPDLFIENGASFNGTAIMVKNK